MKGLITKVRATAVALFFAFVSIGAQPYTSGNLEIWLARPLPKEFVVINIPLWQAPSGNHWSFSHTFDLRAPSEPSAPASFSKGLKDALKITRAGLPVEITLARGGFVSLSTRDLYGKKLKVLHEGELEAGVTLVPWPASGKVHSGMTSLVLERDGQTLVRQLVPYAP